MVQAYNRYGYVKNNPIKFNDPTGHCEFTCITIIYALLTVVAVDAANDGKINDTVPDGLILSGSFLDTTGTTQFPDDKNSPVLIQKDIVSNFNSSASFNSSTNKAGPLECPALTSCPGNSNRPYVHGISPAINLSVSLGLVWGEKTIKKDIRTFTGPAHNISLPFPGLPVSINAFSSVDQNTGKWDFKTFGVSVGVGWPPKVPSVGSYYTNSKLDKLAPKCPPGRACMQ